MKHLIVTSTLGNRGGHVIQTNLARELLRQGIDVDIVGFKPDGTEDYPNCEPLYRGLNVEIVPVPLRADHAAQMKEYIDAAVKVLEQRQSEYKTIVLDSWFVVIAGIVSQLDPDKLFQLVQADPVFMPQDSSEIWKARIFDILPYYPMRRIVVSKSIQSLFKERYGQDYPQIDLYVDDAYRQATYEVIDRPVTRFVSSASDFTITSKGLDTLLKVFDEYKGPAFELTLISGKPILPELIENCAYPIHCTYAATPQEMIAILHDQDVYVSTSIKESFGLALAEAVTLGMPAVALDSVGNRDYAQGDNFIFVKYDTELRAQLEKSASLSVRHELHAHAKPSMEQYTLENMVRQFRDITHI